VVASLQATNAGASDGFLLRVLPPAMETEFSTYLGGSLADSLWDVQPDALGNIHVVGESFSTSFPGVSTNAHQPANAGLSDTIIARLGSDGVLGATFYGSTSEEAAYGVVADPAGNIYLSGSTRSLGFPLSSTNVAQAAYGGGLSDAFVAKFTYEPQLMAVAAEEGIEVSWPSPNPEFVLESVSALDQADDWTRAMLPVQVTGGRHRVLFPLEATNSLFRLRWAPEEM
jgi:hypothetical protein